MHYSNIVQCTVGPCLTGPQRSGTFSLPNSLGEAILPNRTFGTHDVIAYTASLLGKFKTF